MPGGWEQGEGAGSEGATHVRARRIWLVSPAIATIVFFAAQLLLHALAASPGRRVGAATADTPSPMPVKVRVVTQIRSLDERPRAQARVPKSEAALLELFKRQGCVVFSPHEVETIGTQEASFRPEDTGVITADHKLRQARLVPHRHR